MTPHSKEGIKLCRALKSYVNVFVFILIVMRNNLRHFMVGVGEGWMKLLISFLPAMKNGLEKSETNELIQARDDARLD